MFFHTILLTLNARNAMTTKFPFGICFLALLTAAVLIVLPSALTAQEDSPESSEVVTLDIFEVSTDKDVGYRPANTISAMRLDVAINDVPKNITVYNQEFIEDAFIHDLNDITDYEPAMISNFPGGEGGTRVWSRGFNQVGGLFINGMPQTTGFGPPIPIQFVERVEILKGPNAILYGSGAAGGIVNRITKKPLFEPFTQYRMIFGIHEVNDKNNYRFTFDSTGPVDTLPFASGFLPGDWAYRVNMVWDDSGKFRKGAGNHEFMIAPSLLWRISNKTRVYFDFIHNEAKAQGLWVTMLSVIDGGIDDKGRGLGTSFYGQIRPDGSTALIDSAGQVVPDGDKFSRRATEVTTSIDLRHDFNDNLHFRGQFNFQSFTQEHKEAFPLYASRIIVNQDPETGEPCYCYTDPATGEFLRDVSSRGHQIGLDTLIGRRARDLSFHREITQFRAELAWEGDTGGVSHNLLLGTQFQNFDDNRDRFEARPGALPDGENDIHFFSVFFPDGNGPLSFPLNNWPAFNTIPLTKTVQNDQSRELQFWSFYVNDLLSFFDERLFVAAGWRYQDDETQGYSTGGVAPKSSTTSDVWGVGAVLHLTKDQSLSLYFNADRSFEPQFAESDDGFDLPPVEGEQLEFGIKWRLYDGRLAGTFSYWDIERVNIPVNISENPDDTILRPGGKGIHTEGIEFDVRARLTDNWQLFGGYMDMIDMVDPNLPASVCTECRPMETPETGATIFTSYRFDEGPLKGFLVSIGGVKKGERTTDWQNNAGRAPFAFSVDDPWRWDLTVGRRFEIGEGDYTLRFNIKNFTDETLGGRNRWFGDAIKDRRLYRVELRAKF